MADDHDRFDPSELDTWDPVEPATDFVDQVMRATHDGSASSPTTEDAADTSPRTPRRSTAVVLGIAAGIAAAAVVLLVARARVSNDHAAPPSAGSFTAADRSTVALGGRGVAVAEPGAALQWSVDQTGTTDVQQTAGRAFYRVDRGTAAFRVRTPSGTVTVLGTCFTIDVSKRRTSVTVHEGRVLLDNPAGSLVASAGTRAIVDGRAPRVASRRGDSGPTLPAPDTPATALHRRLSKQPTTPADASRDDCYCRSDPTYLEADAALRRRWAGVCRVRADAPPLETTNDSAIEPFVDLIGGKRHERQTIIDAVKAVTKRGEAQLLRLYIDATGDEKCARTMTPEALLTEVDRTGDKAESARVRQKLSRERAGLLTPPDNLSSVSPYEELYRTLIALGDDLETELARRLGRARARELRLRHGGWPGPGLDWIGCPN